MQFGKRQQTAEINEKIIEAYFEGLNPGAPGNAPLSVTSLMEEFGRSESLINKLLARYKKAYREEHGHDRPRNGTPRDPRLMEGKASLTFRHFYIGQACSRYIREHQLTPTSFGNLINKTRVVVGNILIGAHDFTLTEVETISEVIGIPFLTLVNQESKLHVA